MSEALAFPHEREVTKLARRFRAARRRGFVACVGADEGLRARVEAALRERLGEGAVVSVVVGAACADPWGALLAARTEVGQVVSARLEVGVENTVLRALDVRRELLHGEEVALMLWVGLGDVERVASVASNLWSYRSDVAWFFSRADIEMTKGEVDEGPVGLSLEENLRRTEERIAHGRTINADALQYRAWLLLRFGRLREALAASDDVGPHLVRNSRREQEWRFARLHIYRGLNRVLEARAFAEAGRDRHAPKERALERVDIAFISTEWRTGCVRLEQIIPMAFRWEATIVENDLAPTCTRAAVSMWDLGLLAPAERWLGEAARLIVRRKTEWWPLVATSIEYWRARIAWERLDSLAALQNLERSLRRSERMGALNDQKTALEDLANSYASLGLTSDARYFRELAGPTKERLAADPPPPKSDDTPPERPIDTPFARLERAVWDAEHALDAGRTADVPPALDACAAAWAAEDERYRSLRLFDRWQQCLARHLAAQGDEDGAVRTLRDDAERLVDLPRTRLGTLLALAKLPLGPAHTAVREAAATEVLSRAMTAGALALERDARRALTPLVRARGEGDEADFHEAEAARISAALDDAATP